jgi:uncharacterized protein involved in exopolysaccharide biosynthesis/Mrp family chromosome partitioning ATPase
MNNNRQTQPPPGISLGDIYYTVFRHKWKIVITSMMGILAAAAIYHVKAPLYESQAKLLIKYVPDFSQTGLAGDNQRVLVPDSDGDDIINSEIQILTSLDVAKDAASNFGPANVLAKEGGGTSVDEAAGFIRGNLDVEPADTKSSVIVVTFKHPDPLVVQPLLQEIINAYQQKHYEIHSAGGQFEDALTMEQSTLSVQLNATEQEISDLKNKANIISLDDSQKNLALQLSKVHDEILDAQAEIAGDEAAMKETGSNQPLELQTTNRQIIIPQSQIDAYADVCATLESFRKTEQGYLGQGFTGSNSMLQTTEERIAGAEKQKEALEKKYPQIAGVAPISTSIGSATGTAIDARTAVADVVALKAKIQAWQAQLAKLQTEATNLNNMAPTLAQLQQTAAIEQANYQNLSESLEKSHIDEALDTGKTPNIRSVQTPSPPGRDWKKTQKMMGMAVFGGIFGGLGWAFLIEMFLDRSVKRPVEIERKFKLPLFLSIPDVNRNGHARLVMAGLRRQPPLHNAADANGANGHGEPPANTNSGATQVVSLEQNRQLQQFHEALRDRLILYFDVNNLTHKPKLIAITGTEAGTGVSTIAAGLAASLSETGDGNVLLVDMNLQNGAAQQFYKGKACCGLDTVLVAETKNNALIRENLYVVNGNAGGDGLSQALPRRFTTLVPKLKASDYDYIIFDMPVISPTSVTSQLARFMDMTLLVVESEKTSREAVEQANAWLKEVGATVGVVLNKTRQYVPKRLHQEFVNGK